LFNVVKNIIENAKNKNFSKNVSAIILKKIKVTYRKNILKNVIYKKTFNLFKIPSCIKYTHIYY
jgi:hypothetical protein